MKKCIYVGDIIIGGDRLCAIEYKSIKALMIIRKVKLERINKV